MMIELGVLKALRVFTGIRDGFLEISLYPNNCVEPEDALEIQSSGDASRNLSEIVRALGTFKTTRSQQEVFWSGDPSLAWILAKDGERNVRVSIFEFEQGVHIPPLGWQSRAPYIRFSMDTDQFSREIFVSFLELHRQHLSEPIPELSSFQFKLLDDLKS